jgi:5-methylcytosine-specific restriction protein A
MPKRLCLEPGCRELVNRGRCATHAREHERNIHRAGKKVYNSKRWKILRRHYLNLNPICERCDKTLATDVHHIIDLSEGGEPYSIDNLSALCRSCHSKLTRQGQLGGTHA